ncbi:MAG: pantoate--beta-alanine ligase, partial [Candidatus Zixiibacteriota bacterium]
RNSRILETHMRNLIKSVPGAKIDYISINRWDDLKPVKKLSGQAMISLVVVIEGIRLLDNVIINVR